MRRSFRGLWLMVRTASQADPRHAMSSFGITVFESVIRTSWPYLLKRFIDGAIAKDDGAMLFAAATYGVSMALLGITNLARLEWLRILEERTGFLIDQRLMHLSADVATIEHHERPGYLKEMELLRQQRGQLGSTLSALVSNVMIFVQLGGALLLLSTIHPVLLVLPLFGIPSMIAGGRAVTIEQKAHEDSVEYGRVSQHIFQLITSASSAKEIRIFGVGEHLDDRFMKAWDERDRRLRRAAIKAGILQAVGWSIFALGYVGALIFVVIRAVDAPAQVSIGDVLMAFSLAGQMNGHVGNVVAVVRWLRNNLKTVGRYLWLVDYARERERADGRIEPPDRLTRGISLEHVTFRYPDTDEDVLSDVSVEIPAGSTIAIVGENGAGKSTLVKLLCGFYEPTSGRVVVEGTDMANIDMALWRERVAAGFQDFVKFEFLARETVGVGDVKRVDDESAVIAALSRAHADEVVPTLGHGLATQVGRTFEGGVELSVGQWQKLALGRAMMREAPLLLVLDEPTASLDAQTEHALFERYAGASRRVAEANGAVTVLVSHRFSTVRMANLILVVDRGRVVDMGSHDDLVRRGGLYAELYELQARAYR